MSFLSPGVIVAVLAVVASVAGALGKTELATFLGSPETATTITTVISGALSLFAGALAGIKPKPTV
jgi:hypothetical protein